jgi:hypothetical protein
LVDLDSVESSFTFEPSALNPGLYDISLKETDKAAAMNTSHLMYTNSSSRSTVI